MSNIELYSSINEAYIGKTKELIAMENEISAMRKNKMGRKYFVGSDTTDFDRMVENYFGFDTFALNIFQTEQYNAYTIPIDVKLDVLNAKLKKNSICDPKGFKYKKEAGYCVITCISTGLFYNENFTDGEILAIILHEIGHNFASVIDNGINLNQFLLKWVDLVLQLVDLFIGEARGLSVNINFADKLNMKLNEIIVNRLPGLMIILGVFSSIGAMLRDAILNVFVLIGTLGYINVARALVSKITSIIFKPTAYTNEKIADNFVTVYGYGPELSSALLKFDDKSGIFVSDLLNEIPLIGDYLALKDLPAEIIVSAFDEHPYGLERTQDQIRLLENELKKSNLDPKMKQKMNMQIAEIKALQDNYIPLGKTQNANVYKKAWYQFVFNLGEKGDTKHKFLGTKNFDKIDDTLGVSKESTDNLDWY